MDRDALFAVLAGARARVAISGYGDEWDGLGWRKETREAQPHRNKAGGRRVEALWMNYAPIGRLPL